VAIFGAKNLVRQKPEKAIEQESAHALAD